MINLRVNQPTNTNFKAAIKPNKVLVESAETVLKNAKPVTAALALATIVPASIKQKENDVEMISEDFIKNRKGKSLTEEEIQVYKDKWNYLSENKSLSEDNKIVAHSLCQNPNIDKDTALKSLASIRLLLKSAYDKKEQIGIFNRIIDSEKIPNEVLPNILASADQTKGLNNLTSFLDNFDFIYENIEPECYINFMRFKNQERKPDNYKPDKVSDEIIALNKSLKNGRLDALSFINRYSRSYYDFEREKSYTVTTTDQKKWQKEIDAYIKNGMTISDIAKKLGTTEDCINALRYLDI